MAHNQELGFRGQDVACAFLVKKGYRFEKANFRTCFGEIDLIMKDGPSYVFIEVKTRRNNRYGEPEEAVTREKRQHLTKAAWVYLARVRAGEASVRFDVVSIGASGIRHYENAFDGSAGFYF